MPSLLDLLDVPSAVARTLHDCRHYDCPNSVLPGLVFTPGSGPRQKLEADVRCRIRSGIFGESPAVYLVPKSAATTRIMTIPSLVDQVVYEALISWLSGYAEPLEHPDTHSFRAQRGDGPLGWIEFQKALVEVGKGYGWVASYDLADFFETITHARLGDRVASFFVEGGAPYVDLERIREAILRLLTAWHAGGRGLPQGPRPSFFLADVFMLAADRRHRSEGRRQLRWVDDRYFFTDSYQAAQRACRAAEEMDRADLLVRSTAKARILDVEALRAEWEADQRIYNRYWDERGRLSAGQQIDWITRYLAGKEGDLSRHVVRFLLNRACELACHREIDAVRARRLGAIFQATVVREPHHAARWATLLCYLAKSVEIQELCADLIREDVLVDDTSTAEVYNCLLRVDAEPYVVDSLGGGIERDAADTDYCSSRRGKALVLAAKSGLDGWPDLVPVSNAEKPDLRGYQAIAGQAHSRKERDRYTKKLVQHTASATEAAFIEHFRFRQTPLWATPLEDQPVPFTYG